LFCTSDDTNEILIYGQEHSQELLRIFKELKSSDVWNTLQDHWKLYLKKHYARDDNQVEELREPEEECEANDKYDWQIDMPDGDEIDDEEDASVDDDSPPSRNR
jgi:hypothetical protein